MSLAMFMAVCAGGAHGAMNRYVVAQFVGGGLFGIARPMATLVVNVAGSSLMGAIAGGIAAGGAHPPEALVHHHGGREEGLAEEPVDEWISMGEPTHGEASEPHVGYDGKEKFSDSKM